MYTHIYVCTPYVRSR